MKCVVENDIDGFLRVRLPFEMTNGNDGRGEKWFSSAKWRKLYEQTLRADGMIREPFEHPVRLAITRVLKPRQSKWDADSILRGNAKEIIDALVAVGWFHDDGIKWITEVTGRQDDTQRQNGPATIVEVFG